MGTAWGRLFDKKRYGYVADDIPEIAMALKANHRNLGIGTHLLTLLESHYRQLGIEELSLSVSAQNPATRLYRRFGYRLHSQNEQALPLIKSIQ